MHGPVVTWFEIMGKDSARLQRFYRDLFGWKLTPPIKEMGSYSMLERASAKPGIGGGIGEGDPRVSIYVEVADPEAYLEKASASGATILMPVTQIAPTTTIAMLRDPGGNVFGLLKAMPATRRSSAAKKTTKKVARPTRKKTTAASRGRRKTTRR